MPIAQHVREEGRRTDEKSPLDAWPDSAAGGSVWTARVGFCVVQQGQRRIVVVRASVG